MDRDATDEGAGGRAVDAFSPARLSEADRAFVRETVERFFGPEAAVHAIRYFEQLVLHVVVPGIEPGDSRKYDCVGVLYTRLDHSVLMSVERPNWPVHGPGRIALRRGELL
jgi:hypothetical protein